MTAGWFVVGAIQAFVITMAVGWTAIESIRLAAKAYDSTTRAECAAGNQADHG